MESGGMKQRVAHSIKWNVVDKVASQALYAITGVVLANVLSPQDFGLVGAVMVFQAFASLFVDSGFSSALIQRKAPSHLDYSTVLWFNIAMAVAIYIVLFAGAPLIADCFEGDRRLIPLSRVMFISFIINATSIVQHNRLMKQMNVRPIAIANTVGLIAGGAAGIILALHGAGAWAIVWQTIILATVKSAMLWIMSRWLPLMQFSWQSLKSFFSVGMGVMGSSLLNTIFQNIYSFFIGNRAGLVPLGYYTQADKWSKMGIASLSGVLTSSFLPALSEYQDDPVRFAAATSKMNRFTAYVLFPATGFLMIVSAPLFHVLFGTKWDAAIPLFCLLLDRGIFTVLTSLYSNYILALGRSRLLVFTELLRDATALVAIFATLPIIAFATDTDPVAGLRVFLWWQIAASGLTWIVTLIIAARLSKRSLWGYLVDCVPYMVFTLGAMAVAWWVMSLTGTTSAWLLLLGRLGIACALYLAAGAVTGSRIQADMLAYLLRRKSAKE